MLSDAAEGSPSRPSDNTLGCTDEVAAAAAVEAMAINADGAEDLLLEIAEGSAGATVVDQAAKENTDAGNVSHHDHPGRLGGGS